MGYSAKKSNRSYDLKIRRLNGRKRNGSKKFILPPTNLKGIETHLRNKRYRINVSLEAHKPGAKMTFEKPLPDGRRLHGSVHNSKMGYKIRQHIDSADPNRHPVGHLLKDCTRKIPNSNSIIPKKKIRKRSKSNKRSYI